MRLDIILSLAVLVAVGWFWLSRRRSPVKITPRSAETPGSKYHAVMIKCGNGACEAAVAIQGKPILSHQAPTMPLPECDHTNCSCHFSHRQDRRDDERRTAYAAAYENVVLATQDDRRHPGGRRQPKP